MSLYTWQECGEHSENPPTVQRGSVKYSQGMQIKSVLYPRMEHISWIQILLSKIHSTSYKLITIFTFKTMSLHTLPFPCTLYMCPLSSCLLFYPKEPHLTHSKLTTVWSSPTRAGSWGIQQYSASKLFCKHRQQRSFCQENDETSFFLRPSLSSHVILQLLLHHLQCFIRPLLSQPNSFNPPENYLVWYEEAEGQFVFCVNSVKGVQKSQLSRWFNQSHRNTLPPTGSQTSKSDLRSEG